MGKLRPVAVITGASAGIGVALARVFARDGHELALVARTEDRLRTLADEIAATGAPRPIVLAADLLKPGIARVIGDALAAQGVEPQFVVNNAGFGLVGAASLALNRRELPLQRFFLGRLALDGESLALGGHFFFDVNNRLAFEKVWPGVWWIEKPGVVLVMRGGWVDRDGVGGRTDIEWFVREGNLWRRRHEHVEQVAWSAAEMRRAMREAGFDRVRAFDATPFFTGDPKIGPGCRTFYLARKAG